MKKKNSEKLTNKITLKEITSDNKVDIYSTDALNYNFPQNKKESEYSTDRKIIIKHNILKQNQFKNYDAFSRKPSEKYKNVKTANPFSSKNKHKTKFSQVYDNNGIPCHLKHSGVKMALQWEKNFDEIDYNQIIPLVFEGIIETKHPYCFIARQACKELMSAPNAKEKILPLLSKIFVSLRISISNNDIDVFLDSLDICQQLVELEQENCTKYLNLILQPLNKRTFEPKFKEKIFALCNIMETFCGNEASKLIRNKIPIYNNNSV